MFLKVISNREEFDSLLRLINSKQSMAFPVMVDTQKHAAVNPLSVLFVFVDDDFPYVLTFNHNEGPNIPVEWLLDWTPYSMTVPDKADFLYWVPNGTVLDSTAAEYCENAILVPIETPKSVEYQRARFRNFRNINRSIPMMKLVELATNWKKHVDGLSNRFAPPWYDQTMLPVCHAIESAGLEIDTNILSSYVDAEKLHLVVAGNRVYTKYYPYTVTGRPSNAFGGINFAALNKHDGIRKSFISRFRENGKLVLMDFESFHLRLIADIIGFPQPSIPFHEYLGRLYNGSGDVALTAAQYEEGKRTTFSHLYGESRPRSPIPFFEGVYKWIDDLWINVQFDGILETPIMKRKIPIDRIDEPSKSKVFNYLIQATESEVGFTLLKSVLDKIEHKQSRIILYTYDSILLDVLNEEEEELLPLVRNTLESNGKYPTRTYVGNNYHEMHKV